MIIVVDDPDDFFEHQGVKGMKWGVINEDKPTGKDGSAAEDKTSNPKKADDESTSRWKKALEPTKDVSAKEAAKNLSENKQKFSDKFGGDPKAKAPTEDKQGFHISKKQALAIGVGAAFVGYTLYKMKTGGKNSLSSLPQIEPGQHVNAETFGNLVQRSKNETWAKNDYLTKQAFDRPEFTLPAGHIFHRISGAPESGFRGGGTYVTHSTEDFNRYVSGFRGELGQKPLHHITFQTKEETKVANLTTVLDTLKENLTSDYKKMGVKGTPSDKAVLKHYQDLSGGNWGDDGFRGDLIKSLQKKGYGALVDEMDAGVIGETPLVIFNPKVKSMAAQLLSSDEITQAESSLIEFAGRKP